MIQTTAVFLALTGLVANSQKSTGEQDSLLALGNILDQVALQCLQIPILAIAIEDECKNTPVCCKGGVVEVHVS
ncbi:hypothetical protein E3P77_02548 [Wallemia ichthyophaga]|nr:hypothetical protein E3P78_02448 [Wallemia ichthyophaga]TIB65923.1 hypothetical protein E3P77_02548 [Wallemia ichthyophaga]